LNGDACSIAKHDVGDFGIDVNTIDLLAHQEVLKEAHKSPIGGGSGKNSSLPLCLISAYGNEL
jgi:hypothetical protein